MHKPAVRVRLQFTHVLFFFPPHPLCGRTKCFPTTCSSPHMQHNHRRIQNRRCTVPTNKRLTKPFSLATTWWVCASAKLTCAPLPVDQVDFILNQTKNTYPATKNDREVSLWWNYHSQGDSSVSPLSLSSSAKQDRWANSSVENFGIH